MKALHHRLDRIQQQRTKPRTNWPADCLFEIAAASPKGAEYRGQHPDAARFMDRFFEALFRVPGQSGGL